MASIVIEDLHVDFPIYGMGSRSLKRDLLRLGKKSRISRESHRRVTVHALRGITLTFEHGDRIGLVGPNGAGKSTLLRAMAGIYEPAQGSVRCEGRVISLFNPRLGMNLEASGYDNIKTRALAAGLSLAEIKEITPEIAEFSELGDYLELPMHTYSQGMVMRLAFAIITAVVPDILLMDEWVGAGDKTFLEKARARIQNLVDRAGILVLASHIQPLLQRTCNKIVLIEAGEVKAFGPTDEILT